MRIDRIVFSSDDSEFIQYWKLVVFTWKKFFPTVKVNLAFVTNRDDDDELIKEIRQYGDGVFLYPEVPNIPTFALGMLARSYLSTQFGDDVCMIDDMDTIPLQIGFFQEMFDSYKKDKIQFKTTNYYRTQHPGKYPMGSTIAQSYVWKNFLNPNNLSFSDLMMSFIGMRVYDNQEDVSKLNFSDESLFRVLNSRWDKNKNVILFESQMKNLQSIYRGGIKNIDVESLSSQLYKEANLYRPFDKNFEMMKPLCDFLIKNDCGINDVVIGIGKTKSTDYLKRVNN